MARYIDITGQRFGMLTVVELCEKHPKSFNSYWNCLCDCGKYRKVLSNALKQTLNISCGCNNRVANPDAANEKRRERNKKRKKHPAYSVWQGIKGRCFNKNNKNYHNYGGRGITLFEPWINDFEAFLEHIGERPSAKYSLDRIDNSKGYEPGNLRWATITMQARNRRNNTPITYKGETKIIVQWCEDLNISYSKTQERLKRGIPFEEAIKHQNRIGGVRGNNHPSARITVNDVAEIRSSPQSAQELGAKYGVTPGHIADIRKGRVWKHTLQNAQP